MSVGLEIESVIERTLVAFLRPFELGQEQTELAMEVLLRLARHRPSRADRMGYAPRQPWEDLMVQAGFMRFVSEFPRLPELDEVRFLRGHGGVLLEPGSGTADHGPVLFGKRALSGPDRVDLTPILTPEMTHALVVCGQYGAKSSAGPNGDGGGEMLIVADTAGFAFAGERPAWDALAPRAAEFRHRSDSLEHGIDAARRSLKL